MLTLDEYNNSVLEYKAATQAVTSDLVAQWKEADIQPREESKGVWTSVYQVQPMKGKSLFIC